MREPVQVVQNVNGVSQIITKDIPPIRFENGEYFVDTNGKTLEQAEEELKMLREHRHNGVLFSEVPDEVMRVADKNDNPTPADQQAEQSDEPEETEAPAVETTVVEEVDGFNAAVAYFKEEFGKEHKQVNSKDKLRALRDELALEFPNYLDLDE